MQVGSGSRRAGMAVCGTRAVGVVSCQYVCSQTSAPPLPKTTFDVLTCAPSTSVRCCVSHACMHSPPCADGAPLTKLDDASTDANTKLCAVLVIRKPSRRLRVLASNGIHHGSPSAISRCHHPQPGPTQHNFGVTSHHSPPLPLLSLSPFLLPPGIRHTPPQDNNQQYIEELEQKVRRAPIMLQCALKPA